MPDVIIIGAGIHGASAAYHLARSGASVTVVEREFPASGPTGLSSAICRAYYTNRFLAEVARDSIAMFADFEAASGGRDASFRRTGFLYLHPEADAERVRNTTAALNELGIAVDLLTPDDLRSGFPDVNPDGIGIAAFERDAGYADPVGTTTGLLSWAQDHGAEVLNRSRVTAISADDAGTIELATHGGRTLACDRLLIAAGPWSGALARQLGVDLPLTVERHIVAVAAWGAGERMGYGHIDVAGGYYCRPEGAERFCLGGLTPGEPVTDPDSFNRSMGDPEALGLLTAAAHRIPGLDESQPRGGWVSVYDVSPDWQPVIGEIAPGVFIDAGTSGHGFKLAPALGRHVADMILGHPDPGLAQFSPARFATGRDLAAGFGTARIIG